jgi:hypothetical protein
VHRLCIAAPYLLFAAPKARKQENVY